MTVFSGWPAGFPVNASGIVISPPLPFPPSKEGTIILTEVEFWSVVDSAKFPFARCLFRLQVALCIKRAKPEISEKGQHKGRCDETQ